MATDGSSPLARGTLDAAGGRQLRCRFIPAGAGNTRPRCPSHRLRSVHPRWRGEHLDVAVGTDVGPRFIPAGAGNTSPCRCPRRSRTVHPRWRGEHSGSILAEPLTCGSSPLARGTPQPTGPGRRHRRFIPAGAGNTRCTADRRRPASVHPRWRGEHANNPQRFLVLAGSSPLARGTHHGRRPRVLADRFIPAGAGNTAPQPRSRPRSAVHPRWRGEHLMTHQRPLDAGGSSPLARGTPTADDAHDAEGRFIPAGAGNTNSDPSRLIDPPVHPRWRGEHDLAHADVALIDGSSPLARGTLVRRRAARGHLRFIPAGAGNTTTPASRTARSPVHPRWRGEHSSSTWASVNTAGSSPLARGTHPVRQPRGHGRRFIPAGAGNTPRWRSTAWSATVHPRWRGEHGAQGAAEMSAAGSSPLARGTQATRLRRPILFRFIPAGAGNTRWRC